MKKLLLIVIALTFGWGVKAQCPLQTAYDFTATDLHGERINLFDILDGGQYVLIDFFFTTCGPCIQSAPNMVESYALFGCNQHDVFFIEIDEGDNEEACLNWVNRFGVEYPTISGNWGGTAICTHYGIESFPTVILIAPDRSIVINDLWPLDNVQNIITALENQGLQQHDCNTDSNESISTTLNVSPNPANDFVTLKGEDLGTVRVYNALGQLVDEFKTEGQELTISTTRYGNGVYFLKTNETTLRFVITH